MIRESKDPARILRDGVALERAIVAAQRRVVIRHRQLGIPIAVWREGQVVEIPAENIELPGEGATPGSGNGH